MSAMLSSRCAAHASDHFLFIRSSTIPQYRCLKPSSLYIVLTSHKLSLSLFIGPQVYVVSNELQYGCAFLVILLVYRIDIGYCFLEGPVGKIQCPLMLHLHFPHKDRHVEMER